MERRSVTWQVRERLAWLAWLLDSSIPIPGTRFSIGLEALIGLVPVAGDGDDADEPLHEDVRCHAGEHHPGRAEPRRLLQYVARQQHPDEIPEHGD